VSSAAGPANGTRIGVLFVHGIGQQRESESIRWFGGALVGWLSAWFGTRPSIRRPSIIASHLSYGGGLKGPARFELGVPAHGDGDQAVPDREWIIAEGWWAARISPPDFPGMVRWGLRSAGRSLHRLAIEALDKLRLIAARLGSPQPLRPVARSDPGVFGAMIEFASTLVLALLYLAALPVIYALLLILYVVSLVPIAEWRNFMLVRVIEPFLVQGLGDFQTYLTDDVQAVHIRTRLAEDMRWLVEQERCDDLIVVAHSHGTVVAFDALASGTLPHLERVRKLLTIGAALNNAWALHPESERMRRPLPPNIFWVDFWSYYDPVPGGQLERALVDAPELVTPPSVLQAEMSWYEQYIHPGAVPDGSRLPPSGPLPRQVTNGMNVLTDHDGYFRNSEQFLSRLAAEIDVPRGSYKRSGFLPEELWKRTKRRRLRVTTLVGWRLAAMALFVLAVVLRVRNAGVSELVSDGRGLGSRIDRIPGANVLGAPGEVVNGVRELLAAAAADTAGLPWLSEMLSAIATWLGQPLWGDLRDAATALIFFAALFVGAYLTLVWLLFRPWDEREARESVMPELPPHRPRVLQRTLAVLAGIAVLALVVARL
jgi:hypothetical protein